MGWQGPEEEGRWARRFSSGTQQGRSKWVGRKAEAKRVAPGVVLLLEM